MAKSSSGKIRQIDADAYPPEALADEEPRYLRRQRPVEIKRRKFGRKAWKSYLRASLFIAAAAAGAGAIYAAGDFLLTSPLLSLRRPSQVEISGNHYVTRASVLEIFAADRGKSLLRIPLEERRAEIEQLTWVENATVRRALPGHIEVEITERTPVAFLREGANLFLVDAHGVILDRPLSGDFHFPVVAGISSASPLDQRAQRMKMMVDFMNGIRSVRANAADSVSEINLSDASDLQATLVGLGNAANGGDAILVHFGNDDFQQKFQVFLNNITQWEAAAGKVASVDLRFQKEVVVNPETPATSMAGGGTLPQAAPQGQMATRQSAQSGHAHPARRTRR